MGGTYVPSPPSRTLETLQVREMVDDRFDITQAFANEAFAATKEYMQELTDLVGTLTPPDTGDLDDVAIPAVADIDYSLRPTLGNLILPSAWPTVKPTSPTLDVLPTIEEITIPVATFSPPTWSDPVKPTPSSIAVPGEAPVFTLPDMPTAPSISLPSAPTLSTIVMPSAPSVSIPEVDFDLEGVVDIGALEYQFVWEESPYNSDVWNSLLANVVNGLVNGGTGLSADIEQEIWERAQRRQQAINDKLYRDIEAGFASKGWPLPPGVMAGQMLEAAEEIARNDTDLNGKIAIEQANLAQKNSQFVVERGVDLERILREFHASQMGRTLEAAKITATAAIDLYRARLERYTLDVERVKARAMVYEARLRAAIETVNLFKAQVEAAKVSADVQQTLVLIYERQIAAVETSIKLYTAQMEAVKIAGDIQQLKLEGFKTETQAYVARIEAERSKYDIYGKEVDAEVAKAQSYAERVKGFVAEIEAVKVKNELQVSRLNAAATRNTQLIEQYKGELQGYTAEVDAASKQVDGVVRGFEAEARAYAAETGAVEAMYSAKVKEIEARISQSQALIAKAVAQIDAATKGYVAIKELQTKAVEGQMNVSAQMTASALSAAHASATVGGSIQRSEGYDYNHSESLNESHSFQHDPVS
ncbi:MAG: hypothetical protein RBS34_00290 [Desulfofustis sp.]|jgi:hypothetical protein|nr:hypothetical protein [Desulfofustis sp.]